MDRAPAWPAGLSSAGLDLPAALWRPSACATPPPCAGRPPSPSGLQAAPAPPPARRGDRLPPRERRVVGRRRTSDWTQADPAQGVDAALIPPPALPASHRSRRTSVRLALPRRLRAPGVWAHGLASGDDRQY